MQLRRDSRNLRIVLYRELGMSFGQLALKYHISAVRAYQIYNETLIRYGMEPMTTEQRQDKVARLLLSNHFEDLDPDTPEGFYWSLWHEDRVR